MKSQLTNTLYYSILQEDDSIDSILQEDDSIDYRPWATTGIVRPWRKLWEKESRKLWKEESRKLWEEESRKLEAFKAKEASRVAGAIARKFFDDNPTVDLVKPMRKATLKDFGDHPYIPSHKLDVGPVKSTSLRLAQTQEILGDIAGFFLSPSYGLDVGSV